MTMKSSTSSRKIDEAQLAKVYSTVDLLERHLHDEERDRSAGSYRLGWYQRLQTRECKWEDIDHFRRFVDEMCERALKRASRTQALFPSPGSSQPTDTGIEFDVLRARQLCESFCASLNGD